MQLFVSHVIGHHSEVIVSQPLNVVSIAAALGGRERRGRPATLLGQNRTGPAAPLARDWQRPRNPARSRFYHVNERAPTGRPFIGKLGSNTGGGLLPGRPCIPSGRSTRQGTVTTAESPAAGACQDPPGAAGGRCAASLEPWPRTGRSGSSGGAGAPWLRCCRQLPIRQGWVTRSFLTGEIVDLVFRPVRRDQQRTSMSEIPR